MTLGFEQFGTGRERVIALPDWMSTHQGYAPLRHYLNPQLATWVFADNRGYGLSRGLPGTFTTESAAGEVIALADELGWDRFHLVGHSMSGMIAQRVSLDYTERLESLVLVTPVTARGMPLDADGRKLFEGAVDNDELWLTVAKAVTSARLSDAFYTRKLEQHRAAVDRDAFSGYLEMWTKGDFSAKLEALATRTLVVVGAHDFPAFTHEAYKDSIGQWYSNVEYEVLATGHYPMVEAPPRFAQVLENFLGAESS